MVFRSTALHSLSDDDSEHLQSLNTPPSTICGLRKSGPPVPDAPIGEQANLSLDVLADADKDIPAKLHEVLVDPAAVAQMNIELAGGKAVGP